MSEYRPLNSNSQVIDMLLYQLRVVVQPFKDDEFVKSVHSLLPRIRRQAGCLGYRMYRDSEEKLTYCLVGEWKTRRAMEKHFKTNDYDVLVGAARILGESFTLSIAEVSQTGGMELTRELSAPLQQ